MPLVMTLALPSKLCKVAPPVANSTLPAAAIANVGKTVSINADKKTFDEYL
jgi:hypothetical protein